MTKNHTSKLVRLLEWDTKFFNKRIARYLPLKATNSTLRRAMKICKDLKVACVCWRAAGDHYTNVILAEKYGFSLAGTRVSYRRVAGTPLPIGDRGDVVIRRVRDSDMPTLYAQTDVLSQESRFFRDENFGVSATRKSYREWLKRLIEDATGAKVFVADFDGEVAGYIASGLEKDGTVHIELVFIDEKFRGRSLGRSLLAHVLAEYEKGGHTDFLVITQSSNIPAQRLYQSCGFRITNMEFDYHKWFN